MLYYDEKFLGQSRMEWLSDQMGWRSEFYNPIGQTILAVSYEKNDNNVSVSGVLEGKLPPIKLLPQNFLEVDGYFVPLKAAEISCLMNHKWPGNWLQSLVEITYLDDSLVLHFHQSERSMKIEFMEYKRFSNRKSCAEIHWDSLWGLVDSQFIICVSKNKRERAEIIDLAGYKLIWDKQKD